MCPTLQRFRTCRQAAVLLLFATLLLIPLADQWFHFAPIIGLDEKRVKAQRPPLPENARDVHLFPHRFEKYYNDAFGCRALLTYWHNYIQYFWFRSSPTPMVMLGRDGWLFFGMPEEIRFYQNASPLSLDEVRLRVHLFTQIEAWLAKHQKRFVMLLVPNKSTVYPEYMPAGLPVRDQPSRLNQFVADLRQRGITIVDLRENFARERQTIPVYYTLDTHWTPIASHLAARAVRDAIFPREAAAAPTALPNWTLTTNLITGDLAILMGLDRLLFEPKMELDWAIPNGLHCIADEGKTFGNKSVFTTTLTNQPSALLMHDSFMTGAHVYPLAAQFSKLTTHWSRVFDPAFVREVNPDIVIFEFVERMLSPEEGFGSVAGIVGSLHDVKAAVDFPRRVGANVSEADSIIGAVRRATAKTPPGWLLFGGYETLTPGPYEVLYRLKARPAPTDAIARLDVSAERGTRILAERTLDAAAWKTPGAWEEVRLPFTVPESGAAQVECRVEFRGGGDLEIDYLKVQRTDTAAPPAANL